MSSYPAQQQLVLGHRVVHEHLDIPFVSRRGIYHPPFNAITCSRRHQPNKTPLPPLSSSACLLKASALNFLNAFSILALEVGSLVIVRDAEAEPSSKPVTPPKKSPAIERNEYVAISPTVVGFRRGVMSRNFSFMESAQSV